MASRISERVTPKIKSIVEENRSIMELPIELLTEIICRLPISSLDKITKSPSSSLRNKELHGIISDPKFPQFFQSYNNIVHPTSFLMYRSHNDIDMFLAEYDPNSSNDLEFTRLNIDFFQRSRDYRHEYLDVLASYDGWLLVRLGFYGRALDSNSMRLVNPITRRCLIIPQAKSTMMNGRYAIGYVPKTGKYKLVRFFGEGYEMLTINDDNFENTDWRRRLISQDHQLYHEYTKNGICNKHNKQPVVWDGSLYWLVDEDTKILKLDMDKEDIELVTLPNIVHDSGYCGGFLGLLGESLYIGLSRFGKGLEVWVAINNDNDNDNDNDNNLNNNNNNNNNIGETTKEYWKKWFVIGESECRFDDPFEIIRIYDDGNILIYSYKSKKLYFHDPKGKRRDEKTIEIQGMDFMDVVNFVPSFLPLKHVSSN